MPAVTPVTDEPIRLVVVCANRDCRERLLVLHVNGTAHITMLMPCSKCGVQTDIKWTPNGVVPGLVERSNRRNV